jgi:predicted DNA-binding transcriptional regulator YafY
MRASRLMTILLLLQSRGRLTAADLAVELEVSERTIYRDLDELSAAGVPVYGERGRAGGYRLLDGYRTTLTGLTAEEAGALLLAGAPGPAAELGFGALLAASRLKLLAAVPASLREIATRAEARFHLDPTAWRHERERNDRHLRTLAQAVWHDRRVRIEYHRPGEQPTWRTIDPLGLIHKTGHWYLVARHQDRTRVYRVDRIERAGLLAAPSSRPAEFDLEAFWARWEADYAATLPAFSARVRLGPEARRYRDSLGSLAPRAAAEEPPDAAGWVEQTLLFDDRRVAVAALLALAPEIEVLAPADLRSDLCAVASAAVARQATLEAPRDPSPEEHDRERPEPR